MFEFHPVSEIFPLMQGEEFDGPCEDISREDSGGMGRRTGECLT